jgi:hypothetical protein
MPGAVTEEARAEESEAAIYISLILFTNCFSA